MTRKAFVVGHPIAHSRSPLIHGHWLAEHGLDGTYERLDVAPDAFEAFFRGLPGSGFAGGNVTIPHKEAAYRLADSLTERARAIGAVNTLVVTDGRIVGDNTDGIGFIAHLDRSLGEDWPERTGRQALVLGAGGAARAVVAGLIGRGLTVRIANRSPQRAQALAALDPTRASVLPWEALPEALPETGLLVNTTSLGMAGHPALALDLAPLPARAAVCDIVYVPLETPLLAAARARGLAAVDGLGMLLHQAVPGFSAWFGVRPEVTPALRQRIVADLTAK
ncbi:shikimate dehydrogenase [Methylorubrum rhodinum]|uniref:Shikimate dehydrogenase (NADP(+)) n=1 Tax=Methylorubrum rhodinum TaxID=29428 RepID=A0A840ZED3_9HYPH|nr:shikimate dehydrogenase [Methylorubrum rhodinum]MBB5755946.1 shikimate dehydrogenase [Methylorubrum rhodinum]